jgi:aspartate carbamoyltransferase regulatory subunit
MPLTVQKIISGTVIDHISAGRGFLVMRILGIAESYTGRVALLTNVPSKAMGKKDIIKIEGKLIDKKTADRIALIAPDSTINLISNSHIVSKKRVEIPSHIDGIFKCPNPKCITNSERVDTVFAVEKGQRLRCHHCERLFTAEEMVA